MDNGIIKSSLIAAMLLIQGVTVCNAHDSVCQNIGMEEAPVGFIAEGFVRHGNQVIANDIGLFYDRSNGSPVLCVKNPIGTVTEQWLCELNCADKSRHLQKCSREVRVYGKTLRLASASKSIKEARHAH